MDLLERISTHIDREWIASRTVELVQIPSLTMEEAEVCRCYGGMLEELGVEVERRQVSPGRDNLYARIRGSGGGPTLMLNGHLDTIPNGNCPPCCREGERIYGRGATDMKGGMAAILGAARALKLSGMQLKGDLLLTAVVGHEEPEAGKDGPWALIEDIKSGKLGCDAILIAEGPDALWVMSMGSMVFTITLESDQGGRHTQYVPFGENPIRHLGEMIQRIHQFQRELDEGQVHPLAGAERIDLGIVEGGDYFNRTPLKCTLTGTRRWSPGRTAGEVRAELEELAAPFARAGNLQLSVEMQHEREPFETRKDDSIVQAAARAYAQVVGEDVEYVGMRIVGDANLYLPGTGLPTLYYGPSNETAHADVEWVEIGRLERAAKIYALTAADYCGVK
ncbi:MAG: M20/M25/M40 family metallo-hydrolase [Gemmatimonadetes bacterium]|jgi:succinyl-diaminopimelate desuccinylase|nr:M20/M25/M40 family metallo-hydrolase [Gemmatimonadota bacterium]